MDLRESVRLGWRNLIEHRLRSALTALGVIIGVGAVIAFVTLGASLQEDIVQQLGVDAQRLQVTAGPPGQPGPPGFQDNLIFTERDVAQLRALEGVEAVVPQGNIELTGLTHDGGALRPTAVFATTAENFADQAFVAGRSFDNGAAEGVLNESAAALPDTDLEIGDTLSVDTGGSDPVETTLVGILSRSSGGLLGDFQEPPFVYLPVDPYYGQTVTSPTTGEDVLAFTNLEVFATDVTEVTELETRIETYLEESSDARELKPFAFEFTVVTSEQIIDTIESVIGTLTGFVTGIALISLVVGAIGIANIMLVSVTERTREIGIMKAVGGQRRAILQLFLVEAMMLGVIGALLGTALGVGLGYVATRLLGLPLVFPLIWFAIAVGVGLVVGVGSGLYPAWRAARLDPIEALRYE